MIDPDSIDPAHYVRIEQALVASGKWVVVDRAQGLRAIKKEQEELHVMNSDRFQNREKWAHWGKLYGVGGVVVANAQCLYKTPWLFGSKYIHCFQHLAIMSANTGEVIAAVENEENGDGGEWNIAPSWEDAVAKLNSAYPKNYEPNKDHKILDDYRALSKEEAVRKQEDLARTLAAEEKAQ